MNSVNAPKSDLGNFRDCLGEYSFTKSSTLETIDVLGWCENERLNIGERFTSHFNELDADDLSIDALLVCKDKVRAKLLSPAGADFPWFPDVSHRADRQTYRIVSKFDAPNAFGVMLPMRYHCEMQHDLNGDPLDDSSWVVKAFEVSRAN